MIPERFGIKPGRLLHYKSVGACASTIELVLSLNTHDVTVLVVYVDARKAQPAARIINIDNVIFCHFLDTGLYDLIGDECV